MHFSSLAVYTLIFDCKLSVVIFLHNSEDFLHAFIWSSFVPLMTNVNICLKSLLNSNFIPPIGTSLLLTSLKILLTVHSFHTINI